MGPSALSNGGSQKPQPRLGLINKWGFALGLVLQFIVDRRGTPTLVRNHTKSGEKKTLQFLLGGFNPSEKYACQIGNLSQFSG